MEKREPQYTVGGKVNWCSHSGNEYGDSTKKLKTELPYDPAIPHFWVLYMLGELKGGSEKAFCTLKFTAALFTMAKRWKQLTIHQ